MSDQMIPVRYAKTLLATVRQHGDRLAAVLEAAGFDFDPFDPQNDHITEIPTLLYSRLFQQISLALQDESFNLRREGDVPNGTFRMMCYCIINCPNLGQALRRADEFYHIVWGDQLTVPAGRSHSYEDDGRLVVMHYEMNRYPGAEDEHHRTVAAGMSIWLRFCSWLIGKHIELEAVELSCSKPATMSRYQSLFNCPIHFDQPRNAFKFSADYLQAPLVHTEETLKEFLKTAPYQLMVTPEDNSLTAQIRSIIGSDFSHGFPSFETLTQLLNTTAPTLRRRLKRENTTYQTIKDTCRRDAATAYLERPELSIARISELMGFSDPSAFHRSFKKWTGESPGGYRQRVLN